MRVECQFTAAVKELKGSFKNNSTHVNNHTKTGSLNQAIKIDFQMKACFSP